MFGGSVCAGADLLPPAGEGWHSLVEVRDGNARPLGKPPARGGRRIHPAPIFAAAGRWLMRAAAWANATTSTPARRVRSEAERTERDAGQIRSCTPTTSAPSATGRQYLPRRRVKRARRSGKIGAGTDTPTPVRTEGRCTGVRPSGLFFWTVHGPFSFPQDGKENGGCILAGQAPLAGASPPWPLFSGPHHSRGRAPKTGAPPLYFSSNTDTYTVPLTSNPSLAFT